MYQRSIGNCLKISSKFLKIDCLTADSLWSQFQKTLNVNFQFNASIYLVKRAIFKSRARSFCWAYISLRRIILKSFDSRRTIRPVPPPRPERTAIRLEPRIRETKLLRTGGLLLGGPMSERCLDLESSRSLWREEFPPLYDDDELFEVNIGGGGGGGVRLPRPVDEEVRL